MLCFLAAFVIDFPFPAPPHPPSPHPLRGFHPCPLPLPFPLPWVWPSCLGIQVKMVSDGLVHFQQAKPLAERMHPLTWPRLSIGADMGPDIVAGVAALQRKYMINVDYTPDTSHGVHNDIWLAGTDAGLKSFMYTLLLTINVPVGPWCEDARFCQVVQALDELLANENPHTCPLFMELFPRIVQETGKDSYDVQGNLEQQIWNELRSNSPWTLKGTKVVKSRFLGLISTWRKEAKWWSRRLFGYLYTCLELGFMPAPTQKLDKLKVKDTAGKEAEKPGTSAKKESSEEEAVRKACSNQMVLGTMFLADPSNLSTLHIILEATAAVEAWHHEQNVALRSVDDSAAWVTAQVDGAFMQHMCDVFKALGQESLHTIGFQLPTWTQGCKIDEEDLQRDEAMAEHLGDFTIALVMHRLKRSLWLLSGWMCRSTLFLHAEEARAKAAVQEFKEDYLLFQRLKENPDDLAMFSKLAGRSMFQLVCYEQLAELLCQANWNLTPEVKGFVEQASKRIISSQLAEDGFNRQKNAPKYQNRRGNRETAFDTLLQTRVLGEVHRYDEIRHDDAELQRDKVIADQAFAPDRASCSFDFSGISSPAPTPTWYSPGADRWAQPLFDLHLVRQAAKNGWEAFLKDAWLGALLDKRHHIVIRAKPDTENRGWLFPLCAMSGSAVLVWPAVEQDFTELKSGDRMQLFTPSRRPRDIGSLFIACVSLSHWEARPVAWRSPAWQTKHFSTVTQHEWQAKGLVAFPEGPAEALLKVAARSAFWALGKAVLSDLAAHVGIEVPAGTSFFDLVFLLVQETLGCSDEECVTLVGARLMNASPSNYGAEQLLETDACNWAFDREDHEEIQKDLKDGERKQVGILDFKEKYAAKRREISIAMAKALPKAKAKRKSHQAVTSLPPGQISQKVAKEFVPPGTYIWRRNADEGWCGHHPPYRRSSYSGLLHGSRGALILQLRDLWVKHCEFTGLQLADIPHPWIMDEAVQVESGAGQQAAASSSTGL